MVEYALPQVHLNIALSFIGLKSSDKESLQDFVLSMRGVTRQLKERAISIDQGAGCEEVGREVSSLMTENQNEFQGIRLSHFNALVERGVKRKRQIEYSFPVNRSVEISSRFHDCNFEIEVRGQEIKLSFIHKTPKEIGNSRRVLRCQIQFTEIFQRRKNLVV